MQSFRVLSAVYDAENDRIEVVKEITEDDATTSLNLHTFAPETLEWKAAEYAIDDPDELVEIILHEPFMEDVRSLQLTPEDARDQVRQRVAETKVRLTPAVTNGKLSVLATKSRLQTAGVAAKYVAAAENDPLEVIKGASPFDELVIDVKRQHLARVRKDLSEGGTRVRKGASPEERAAVLSSALRMERKREAPQVAVKPEPAAPPRPTQPGGLASVRLDHGRVIKD